MLDAGVVSDLPFFTGPNRTKKHRAAVLLADGLLSDRQISRDLKMSRTTLAEWKAHPEFIEVQSEYEHRIRSEALHLAITNKTERLRVLDLLHNKGLEIIQIRSDRYTAELASADSPANATRRFFGSDTPLEAATGLMVKTETVNATGMKTVNWTYDSALSKDIKDTEKQAAQELGQWSEKSEVTTDGGIRMEIIGIADEDMP